MFFAGRVQGVGFRHRIARIIGHAPEVCGTVRNLTDGRVELKLQGSVDRVVSSLNLIHQHLGNLIRSCSYTWRTASEDFDRFTVLPTSAAP